MKNITKPTLLLDESRCRNNINRMVAKTRANNITLRPHFKTHQSREVGQWYYEAGVRNITVSSLEMARYFAGKWEDITLAVPFNVRAIQDYNELSRGQKMILMVDSLETTAFLAKQAERETALWIEIDSGDHRTGLAPDDHDTIRAIADLITNSPKLTLKGFYSHAGHSYKSRGRDQVLSVFQETKNIMTGIREAFHNTHGPFHLNIGDTPNCSLGDDLSWTDSISPGNFVFYDIVQSVIGSCQESQIAVCMVCPVISKNAKRMEIAIHGGVVHFGKDLLGTDQGNLFGRVVRLNNEGWGEALEGCRLQYISQEHGIIKADKETFGNTKVGDLIAVLPIHSCITADCMRGYITLEGKKIDHMKGGTIS